MSACACTASSSSLRFTLFMIPTLLTKGVSLSRTFVGCPGFSRCRVCLLSSPLRNEFAGRFKRGELDATSRYRTHWNAASVNARITEDDFSSDNYDESIINRERVLSYLHTRGISRDQYDDLPLPESLKIVEERLTFLTSIGLDAVDVVNKYPPLIGCSVTRNYLPVLRFLLAIPISRDDIVKLVSKYPRVLYSSVIVDLMPVMDFVLGLGIPRTELAATFTRYPDIFGFRLEGTMSTSVAFLVSIGVNMRSIGPMLTNTPEIMGRRAGSDLLPLFRYLESLGIPRLMVAQMFENYPSLLLLNATNDLHPIVQYLESLGIRRTELVNVLEKSPSVLLLSLPDQIRPAAEKFSRKSVRTSRGENVFRSLVALTKESIKSDSNQCH